MFLYRNRKTGDEFQSNCECNGRDWERIAPSPADKAYEAISKLPVAASQPEKKPKRTTRKKATDDK